MYDVNKFKARTKALCAQNGISQKFVSESTGHGQYFLNDVWQGKRTMSDGDFELAANALRTTSAYLRGETDNPAQEVKSKETPITPTVQELIDEVYGMTDNEAAALLSLIREIKGRRA